MRRREFITSFGSSVVAWPLTARAQQAAMPVIGFLQSGSPSPNAHLVAAFRQGLSESGYVEGRNVAIEFRWAEGRYNELPALAADLVRRRVAVIFGGAPPAARAAKAATATIPIVFTSGDDPVKSGLVASLNRPGGNVTGVAILTGQIGSKLLGLLRELVPNAAVVAVLINPTLRYAEQSSDLQAAARTLGLQLHVLRASTERDIDTAFETLAGLKANALVVGADSFFLSRSDKIVVLAARLALPAIYQNREYAAAGGLVSYGTSLADSYRLAGIYAGRILKGDKPADLPVLQPTKFELVINLKTAKALGLVIPSGVMAIADEVIE
jgi:putative tryptophan/tyrosine transport system substrate-binding protein